MCDAFNENFQFMRWQHAIEMYRKIGSETAGIFFKYKEITKLYSLDKELMIIIERAD